MTDKIQRYKFWKYHPSEVKENKEGEWCIYSEARNHYQKEIEAKDKTIESQAKEIERLKEKIDHLDGELKEAYTL